MRKRKELVQLTVLEILAGNRSMLAVYGGLMTDPPLLGRLAGID